jgi:hypothetical protein
VKNHCFVRKRIGKYVAEQNSCLAPSKLAEAGLGSISEFFAGILNLEHPVNLLAD